MPGVCLYHKEIDRFPSSSTAPKSEILGYQKLALTKIDHPSRLLGPSKMGRIQDPRNHLESFL